MYISQNRLLITSLLLLGILVSRPTMARADALGLATGNYNILVNLPSGFGSGLAYRGGGTLTVGAAGITRFDVTIYHPEFTHISSGMWTCSDELCNPRDACPGQFCPDAVIRNTPDEFSIYDTDMNIRCACPIFLFASGAAQGVFPDVAPGQWTATRVPEPLSLLLVLLGFGPLVVGFQQRRKRAIH